jgi:hypothetical protein
MTKREYESPQVTEYGSVESITNEHKVNKEGFSTDDFSEATNGLVVGSTSPAPHS